MTNNSKTNLFLTSKFYVYLFIFILIGAVLFFGFYTLMEYRPNLLENGEITTTTNAKHVELKKNQSIKLVTWNLGYAGLDAKTNFILDGGTEVFPRNKQAVEENLQSFLTPLQEENANIVFLQEVDESAKRSFGINEKAFLIKNLNKPNSAFAKNFDVFYIPYPFPNMLGKIKSGILTLSDYKIEESIRHQLPGSFAWPKRTVYLKRCLSVNSTSVAESDKKLYFINLHLSAYDTEGKVRPKEMVYLRKLVLDLYNQGHWVIAGGDWNAIFPNSRNIFANMYKDDANKWQFWQDWNSEIEADYLDESWHWIYDKGVQTVRDLSDYYKKGETMTSIIDGFLASPNIEVESVKGINLEFKNTDHQPVFTQIKLK